jgi:hypothetical protein
MASLLPSSLFNFHGNNGGTKCCIFQLCVVQDCSMMGCSTRTDSDVRTRHGANNKTGNNGVTNCFLYSVNVHSTTRSCFMCLRMTGQHFFTYINTYTHTNVGYDYTTIVVYRACQWNCKIWEITTCLYSWIWFLLFYPCAESCKSNKSASEIIDKQMKEHWCILSSYLKVCQYLSF